MSDTKDAKAEEEPHVAVPAGSGGAMSKILLVFVVVNVGVTGFALTKLLKLGHEVSEISAGTAKEAESTGPAPSATMDPFVVNLNEAGASRYLKTSVELEVKSQKVVDELTAKKRAVRDELLRYLSSLTVRDTLGEEGKSKIKQEILARIDHHLGAGLVQQVYLTDFVVQ